MRRFKFTLVDSVDLKNKDIVPEHAEIEDKNIDQAVSEFMSAFDFFEYDVLEWKDDDYGVEYYLHIRIYDDDDNTKYAEYEVQLMEWYQFDCINDQMHLTEKEKTIKVMATSVSDAIDIFLKENNLFIIDSVSNSFTRVWKDDDKYNEDKYADFTVTIIREADNEDTVA
ncbi:MAG: hypothetical protein ACOCRK_07390 [bacterium]